MSDDVTTQLEEHFGGIPLALLLHERKTKKIGKNAIRYSDSMKEFAKTLFFYSPRAYRYVRTHFRLPHRSNIRSWMNTMECEPGFLEGVFNFLKLEITQKTWLQDCSLVFDSMPIRKQLIWEPDKGKYAGNVEFGVGESTDLATEVLVIMVVCLTKQFKCPIAFFYVNKINSSVLSTLLSTAIVKLHEVGIQVWNVTCDGASANIQCFKKLGCSFDIDNLNTKFTIDKSIEVYSMFDTCHMLKLARSSLADKQIIQSKNGDIKWSYLCSLNSFQNELGLKFANKLTAQHIYYRNSVMKVKLAAQTLSSGVADAIEYLCQKGEPSFTNSQATVEFIRKIDRLFDILNSRIPFSKGYKSPIHAGNINTIVSVFNDTTDYLKTLKCDGSPLVLGGRKMFILGFIVTMSSTIQIAYKLLYRSQSPLKFILTYKISQDHLEIFFGCVRARGGSNNNPNCVQFKKSLRQLLFTKNITVENGNCSHFVIPGGDVLDFRCEKRSLITEDSENIFESDINNYLDILNSVQLGEHTGEILDYIAGYIVRSICKKLVCPFCVGILLSFQSDHDYTADIQFTSFVNRGKLKIVSEAVSLIIKELEKSFHTIVVIKKILHKNVKQSIIMLTKKNILNKNSLFFSPNSHPVNVDLGSPTHEYSLFTAISNSYINIRMRHYAKEINSREVFKNKSSLRQKFTKLILFNNL